MGVAAASGAEVPAVAWPEAGDGTADLSLSVVDSADPVDATAAYIYEVDVANGGPAPATSVEVSFSLPSGVGFNGFAGAGWLCLESPPGELTCSFMPEIPAAGSAVTLLIGAAAPSEGGVLSATASVSSAEADPTPNTELETTTVLSVADLSVTLDDGVTEAIPGLTTLVYSLAVANGGPSRDPAATVQDSFPAALEGCTWSAEVGGGASGASPGSGSVLFAELDLPAGGTVTYTVQCTVAAAAVGLLSNTATLTASVVDRNPANNVAVDDDTVIAPLDHGDAPQAFGLLGYPTLIADDGARHVAVGPRLGTLRDAEDDGLEEAAALGDDQSDQDDEDGLDFSAVELVLGETVSVPVTVTDQGADSRLSLWIDFDRNGSFEEAGEQVIEDQLVAAVGGSQTVPAIFTVPPGAAPGLSYARARLASAPGLGASGLAVDGEVEDYRVQLIPRPAISLDDVTALEGDGGATVFRFTVTRSHDVSSPSLRFATRDGTALAGDQDYVALPSQILSFTAGGDLTAFIDVQVLGDGVLESDETFFVDLTSPLASDVTDGEGQGTVLNDDAASLTVSDVSLQEGDAGTTDFLFTLSLAGATGDGFEVEVATVDVTATAGSDYTALQDTVVFAGSSGEQRTVTVTVLGDSVPEGDEIFRLDVAGFGGQGPFPGVATNGVGTVLEDDDLSPPNVTAVATAGAFPAEAIEECAQLRTPFVAIDVTVEDDQTAIVGAASADRYLLVRTGPDGELATASCAAGPAGDDVRVETLQAQLVQQAATSVTARVRFAASGAAFGAGAHRLLVCDDLQDAVGNALDGDGDGAPGGDFVVPFFRVDPYNRFANGHFDDCPLTLDPWTLGLGAGNAVNPGTPGVDDGAGSLRSSSVLFVHPGVEPSSLSQCLAVSEGEELRLSLEARFTPDTDATGILRLECESFPAPDCAGAGLGTVEDVFPLGSVAGFERFEALVTMPAAAVSARCGARFESEPGVDSGFTLALDEIFAGNDGVLFVDGFETGGTEGWSFSTP